MLKLSGLGRCGDVTVVALIVGLLALHKQLRHLPRDQALPFDSAIYTGGLGGRAGPTYARQFTAAGRFDHRAQAVAERAKAIAPIQPIMLSEKV